MVTKMTALCSRYSYGRLAKSSISSSISYNNNHYNNQYHHRYQCNRNFGSPTTGPLGKGYDILGSDNDNGLRRTAVNSLGDKSFMINDVLIRQSVILLPTSYLLWNVRTFDEITIESLSLFPLIYPKLEAVFIGGYDIICSSSISILLLLLSKVGKI